MLEDINFLDFLVPLDGVETSEVHAGEGAYNILEEIIKKNEFKINLKKDFRMYTTAIKVVEK